MKICLSSRQQAEYLHKADEIKVASRDHKIIPELAEKYPNADIILVFEPGVEVDITHQNLRDYQILSKGKFIICINTLDPETLGLYQELGIKYYWGYEITTAYEMEALKLAGVCYARVGAPLFFNTDYLASCGIPVRVSPNLAHGGYMPHADGVNGSWIRPEDLSLYETSIAAIEFEGIDLSAERALFRIYWEQKHWPGELSMIITNLNHSGLNRMLDTEISEARLNCRQRCAEGGSCRICWRALDLANADKIRTYAESQGLL